MLGVQIFTFVVCVLVYFSKSFTDLLENEVVVERVSIAFYMGASVAVLSFAAEGVVQVGSALFILGNCFLLWTILS